MVTQRHPNMSMAEKFYRKRSLLPKHGRDVCRGKIWWLHPKDSRARFSRHIVDVHAVKHLLAHGFHLQWLARDDGSHSLLKAVFARKDPTTDDQIVWVDGADLRKAGVSTTIIRTMCQEASHD